jgi:hypothetical protein
LSRPQREPPHHQPPFLLFGKDALRIKHTRDLVSHQNTAQRRRDDTVERTQVQLPLDPRNQLLAQPSRDARITQHVRALEKAVAVQTGTQFKMPVQQSTGLLKHLQHISIVHRFVLSRFNP